MEARSGPALHRPEPHLSEIRRQVVIPPPALEEQPEFVWISALVVGYVRETSAEAWWQTTGEAARWFSLRQGSRGGSSGGGGAGQREHAHFLQLHSPDSWVDLEVFAVSGGKADVMTACFVPAAPPAPNGAPRIEVETHVRLLGRPSFAEAEIRLANTGDGDALRVCLDPPSLSQGWELLSQRAGAAPLPEPLAIGRIGAGGTGILVLPSADEAAMPRRPSSSTAAAAARVRPRPRSNQAAPHPGLRPPLSSNSAGEGPHKHRIPSQTPLRAPFAGTGYPRSGSRPKAGVRRQLFEKPQRRVNPARRRKRASGGRGRAALPAGVSLEGKGPPGGLPGPLRRGAGYWKGGDRVENDMNNRTWGDGNGGAGSSVMDTARQTVQPVLEQTQQKAGQLVSQARDQVVSQLDSQKARAAGSIGSTAEALRQAAQQLRDHNEAMVAQYLDSAAGYVERFSGYLNQKDIRQMMGEVEDFARREPGLFLGGAFALGFLAARFLKSSSSNGMQSGMSGTPDYAAARGQREFASSGPFTGPAHDPASMAAGVARAETDYATAGFQDMGETAASGRAEIGMGPMAAASSAAPGGTGGSMSTTPGSAGMAATTTPGGTPVQDVDAEDEEYTSTTAAGQAGRSIHDE